MKAETFTLPSQWRDLAQDYFRLLEPENINKKRDLVQLRLSGYQDVMYLISDLVKVSVLALENIGQGSNNANIPSPESNISGVLSIILDLLPYEEAEFLDEVRYRVLEFCADHEKDEDWDFVLMGVSLHVPAELNC